MDNKEILLQTIGNELRSYADWVRDGKGIHSKAAEDFYRELLNKALGYDLGNMNRIRDNFPAIDLGNDRGLAVQVTSTGTAVKVKETLERFYRHKLNNDYRQLIVLVAGSAECSPSKFDHPGVELKIWGTRELVEEFRELPQEKLEEVKAFLEKRVYRPGLHEPLLDLPIGETLGVSRFVGRRQKLEEMAQNIATVKPLVLSGLGGMGKTELARQFGAAYRGGRVYLAQFRGSFYDTVAESIAFGIPGVRERQLDPAQRYALAMEQLRLCGETDILIVDNVDKDGGGFAALKDETYRALCALPMRLILTTRHEVPGAIPVDRMAEDELYKIFGNYGVVADEGELRALIRAVNAHTMTVDLMARTMVGGWKPVTPRMLLDALKGQNLKEQPYEPVESDYNREDRQKKIYDHLRILFDVADIPQPAKDAMVCAVLLPEGGMNMELFGNALPQESRDALNGLRTHGWLQSKGNLVTIHPVVRMVCRTELKPGAENCRDFLHGINGQHDEKQYDAEKLRQMAELFENAAGLLEDKTGFWAGLSGYFWAQVGERRRQLVCSLWAVEKREKEQPDTNELASVYNNVGSAYGALGDYQKALEYNLKALEIRERVLPWNHSALALSYNNMGHAYSNLGNHQKALEYQQKALEIREQILEADHPDLAASYNNVGHTYGNLGEHQKALEYQQKALEIREQVLGMDHPDLAQSYNNVGMAYGALGEHQKALEYQQKALEIRERVLGTDHADLASSYNNVGITNDYLGDHQKALEYNLKALEIYERVLPGDHPVLAVSYNNVGYTYDKLGDHQKALKYKLKAFEIRERVLPGDHPDLALSYSNVGFTYANLGDHQKLLEYLLKALEIRECVLPGKHPDLAVSCNNIAWTYHGLGQIGQAAAYMRRAAEIINGTSLPENHPYRVDFNKWADQMEQEARRRKKWNWLARLFGK